MDFFESQDVARRKTGLLVVYFVAAVVMMIGTLYLVVVFALGQLSSTPSDPPIDWWQPDILLVVVGVTVAVITLGSLFKTLELRHGGEALVVLLGGRKVQANTRDRAKQRLLNVVEEMALAAGVPVPPVYVLDKEQSINAFAAGFTPHDAVIGVNRGTLEHLDRNELQGVMAHEFSHILNGDMRLNLRLVGLLHGILLIALLGFYVLRVGAFSSGSGRRGGENRAGAVVLVVGLGALVIGGIGLLFGRLIKAAVSRQREYLADAAAVQFTRNPDGISGALQKIGSLTAHSYLKTPEAETASHMFFGSAFRRMAGSPFATHPPLVDRIRRVDPSFDGKFSPFSPGQSEEVDTPSGVAPPKSRIPKTGQRFPLNPALILTSIAAPQTEQMAYVREVLETFPQQLREAVHEPFMAQTVVCAMLLDSNSQLRKEQLAMIGRLVGKAAVHGTEMLAPLLERSSEATRLSMVDIVLGTLKELSPTQYETFRKTVRRLVLADRQITLFEFVIFRVLLGRLDRHFRPGSPPKVSYRKASELTTEASCLISALVHVGKVDGESMEKAYRRAMTGLFPSSPIPPPVERDQCDFQVLDQALGKLLHASPSIKKSLLQAGATAVANDGEVTLAEAELFRAVADALDCPLPPIVPQNLSDETPQA